MPLTIEVEGVYASITEAAVVNWSGSYAGLMNPEARYQAMFTSKAHHSRDDKDKPEPFAVSLKDRKYLAISVEKVTPPEMPSASMSLAEVVLTTKDKKKVKLTDLGEPIDRIGTYQFNVSGRNGKITLAGKEYDEGLFMSCDRRGKQALVVWDIDGKYESIAGLVAAQSSAPRSNARCLILTAVAPDVAKNGLTIGLKGPPTVLDPPHKAPWRVVMLAKDPCTLVENNEIILNLNAPCAIRDTSWIQAGRCAWDWRWSGVRQPPAAGNKGEKPAPPDPPYFEENKAYIDLAADMGWEYQLIDSGWYGAHARKPDRPIRLMKWDQTLAHAKKRNVGLWVWNQSASTFAYFKETFPLFRKWGIVGVKSDLVHSDDQSVLNKFHEVIAAAADNKLMMNFHGICKPTGIRRTWPNLLTREAAAGNEYLKLVRPYAAPAQRCIIPFTRMIAGPLDYTPGGFRNVGLNNPDKTVNDGKQGTTTIGTRSAELATMVVYESPFLCICDHPDNYRTADKYGWETGVGFMKVVPATWDDTKVLSGQIGKYITIARKSGKDWFLGAITNEEAREPEISLDFLGDGQYTATVWKDAPDSDREGTKIVKQTLTVNAAGKLKLTMAPGGGVAIHFAAGK